MDSRVSQLEQLLDEGKKFTFENFCYRESNKDPQFGGEDTAEWLAWKTRVFNAAERFGADSSPAFQLAQTARAVTTQGYTAVAFERARASLLKALELLVQSIKEDTFGEVRQLRSTSSSPALSNRVFVVHGHDDGLKTDVERFLLQIGLEPIVLHRQPDQGQTIIEKFERHSDVGYSFILLTPDEIAYTADQEALPDDKRTKERRARPNVIFEFGYFVGRLGRQRVCCIYKGGVVLPSDIAGLVYKRAEPSVDSQAYSIIQELKAAGYQITI